MKADPYCEVDNLKQNLAQIPINERKHPMHIGIVLGPKASGKTKFLNQTNLTHLQTISPKKTECNTWSNQDAIFIEAPETIIQHDTLLPLYIKTITKYRRRKCLDSIIVCLNIYDSMLMSPITFVQQMIAIRKRLSLITDTVGQTRLFIVYTHMDKIAGFCHSFEEIEDAYGYSFTPCPNRESLINQNDKQYKELVKVLHLTLIKRLHETKDELTRYLIREFPLQMESLNNMVRASIKHLYHEELTLSCVFFTSAQQGNSAHDRLSANITQTYALAVSSSVPQSTRDNAFFISGCINKIIAYRSSNQHMLLSKSTISASAACLVIGLALVIHHVRSNYFLNEANQELYIYHHSQGDNLEQVTSALEHLTKAEIAAGNLNHLVPLSNMSDYQKKIKHLYAKGLQDSFLNIIRDQLEQVLSQHLNPIESYHTLKVYLMLGDVSNLDEAYLSNWLNQFWEKNQFLERAKLNKLLKLAIRPPFKGIALNQSLINNIRAYLTALPEDYLYYYLFTANITKPPKTHQFQFFSLKDIAIPYFFQKQHFKTVYNSLIPAYGKQLEKDSYILGVNTQRKPASILRHAYLQNYASWWQKISKQSMPLTFQNYNEAQKVFAHFSDEKSSFDKIRNIIQANTSAFATPKSQDEKVFNYDIAQSFTSFNLFTDNQARYLQPVFNDLNHYFMTLSNAQDGSETAFNIAKARFINRQVDPISELHRLSSQLPAPLSHWVTKLSNNAWNLILQDAQNHINNQWQRLVYLEYEKHIDGNFPFNIKSTKDVSKYHFIHFFGRNGRLAQFFDYYLKPFIDTSSAKWHVRELDGLQLPIHKETITELIRSNVIREMFFSDDTDSPDVAFTLHGIALDPIVKRFTIEINGQILTEAQHQNNSLEFNWPGDTDEQTTQLIVKSLTGKQFHVTESGYWGLFKLLAKANLATINDDTQNYQLILDVNGNAAKFLLSVSKPLNPFIPGILDNFKLPKELT